MEFIFNVLSNRDFNYKVKKSNHLQHGKKRLEIISVEGRTGALIIDDGSRENFNLVIEGFIDARESDLKTVCDELDEWLNGPTGYQTMTFDDGTILKAVFIGDIDPDDIIKNFGELTLEFSAYREVSNQ